MPPLPPAPTGTDRSWAPFVVGAAGQKIPTMRSMKSLAGIGDRLRAVAAAELQARDAFLWAADTLPDASADLRRAWREIAAQEDSHLRLLLARMAELGVDPAERPVGLDLWASLVSRTTAEEFTLYMARAEQRGQRAGETMAQALAASDPATAAVFSRIAAEEVEHVRIAATFFPHAPL